MRLGQCLAALAIAVGFAAVLHVVVDAQSNTVGRNINVITGSDDQYIGDMFRQRQNEPVLGISSINPSHMMAAYNDYRTVDIQDDAGVGTTSPTQSALAKLLNFLMPWRHAERKEASAEADAAQAWIGLSFSDNGGKNWYTGLHPGFHLLANPIPPTADPSWDQAQLLQFDAASDPVIATTHNQFFLAAIAFNPGGNSVGIVSRFTDRNDTQNGQNIQYDGTRVLLNLPATSFVDKPNIAAGPNGHVYVAFVVFDTADPSKLSSKIVFFRSANYGATWAGPVTISDPLTRNQSPWILVDPNNENTVYVGWRVFANKFGGIANAIVGRKSTNAGASFIPSTPYTVAAQLKAFDQPQVQLSAQTLPIPRSNAYPTATIDRSGAIHAAIQEYVSTKDGTPLGQGTPITNGVPRITVTSSYDGGVSWTARKAIDFASGSGTQFMPVLTAVGDPNPCTTNGPPSSRIFAMYYDARNGNVGRTTGTNGYVIGGGTQFDVRIAQASSCNHDSSNRLVFSLSEQLSRYTRSAAAPHDIVTTQGFGYAAVNRAVEAFCGGRCSFTGDYIHVTPRVPYVLTGQGWRSTTSTAVDKTKLPSPVVQGVWADMRDVILPTVPGPALPAGPTFVDGLAWWNYQPPGTGKPPDQCRNPGSRDQNVYSVEYAPGLLYAAAPETFQPSATAPRSYPIYIENRAGEQRFFRIAIDASSVASFDYHSFDGTSATPLLRTADVAIGAFSTVTGSIIIGPGVNTPIDITVAQLVPPNQNGTSPGLLANGARTSLTMSVGSIANAPVTQSQIPVIDQKPSVGKPFGTAFPIQMTPFTQTPFTQTPFTQTPFTQTPFTQTTYEANPFTQTPFSQTTTVYDVTDYTFRVANAGDAAAAFAALLAIGKNLNNSYLFQLMVNRIGQRGALDGCNSIDLGQNTQVSNLFVSVVNPFTQTPFTQTPFTQTPFTQTPFTQTPFTQTPFTQTPFTQTADPRDPTITNATFYVAPAGAPNAGYVAGRPLDLIAYTLRAYQVKAPNDPTFVPLETDPAHPTGDSIGVVVAPEIPPVKLIDGVPVFDPAGPPKVGGGAGVSVKLAFVTQPAASTTAGAPFSVQVAVQDGFGNLIANSTASITVALGATVPGATLSGTLTRAAVGGIATFDGLSLDVPGTYTLVATSGTLAGATSNAFNVINPLIVTNTADSGPGSLRAAMLAANAQPGPSVAQIRFAIPPPSGDALPLVILPQTALPVMTRPVSIDAATQPGYSGVPRILIDGSHMTGTFDGPVDGITLTGGTSLLRGLAIGGFTGNGVVLKTGGNNHVAGNYIGTNLAGTAPFGNGGDAIAIDDSSNNTIGGTTGTTPGGPCTGDCNLLVSRGNDKAALFIGTAASATQVLGNFVGTNAAGTEGLGVLNGFGIEAFGPNTSIGNATPQGRNVVSGNNTGVVVQATGASIRGNYIGTNAAGNAAVVNTQGGINNGNGGIALNGADHALVEGNVVSGNGWGIHMAGGSATDNVIRANIVGLNAAGNAPVPNTQVGIRVINLAHDNIIGAAGAGNVVSGNGSVGILIDQLTSGGNKIIGNFVGVNAAGDIAIGNGDYGVDVVGGAGNVVGGTAPGEGNVIAGNPNGNVHVGSSPSNTLIQGNRIGLNTAGTTGFGDYPNPEQQFGINLVAASSVTIGSTAVASTAGRNVIGGTVKAIQILGGTQITVRGNYLGTSVNGGAAVHNGYGVFIEGSSQDAIDGNVISGNDTAVYVLAAAGEVSSNNGITSNIVGTSADGATPIPNGVGVVLQANPAFEVSAGIVAGTVVTANTIASNQGNGVTIIGLASNNYAAGNTIVGNGGAGIGVAGFGVCCSTGNVLSPNVIYGNGGLGIDLNNPDGVTSNDSGDADSGPNSLQNFPQITSATPSSLAGTLHSAPNGSFQLYFFASDVCDASGYGEGQVLVHSTMVATDGAGNGTFAASISLTAGKFITATAMNTATNDTSEFSQCRVVAVPGAPAQLAFITQPQDTVTGRSISPPVQVAIQDAAGNTVPDAAYPVNLAIGNNPTGVGNLYGTLTRTAVNGVATFPSLAIDTLAAGYDLVATVNTPPMASHPHSAPFSILPQPGDPDLTGLVIPICGDQGDGTEVLNCPNFAQMLNHQLYVVPETGSVNLEFNFVYRSGDFNNELRVFKVDDNIGSINGLNPGDAGYLSAAFARAYLVFSGGAATPSDATSPNVVLPFQGGDRLAFILIQNATLADVIAQNPNNTGTGNGGPPIALFSISSLNPTGADHMVLFNSSGLGGASQVAFEDRDTPGSASSPDFDDMVVTIRPVENTFVGTATDPAGDNTGGSGGSDIVSATVGVHEGNITLSVRFAPGTFGPERSVTFLLDVDENAATGRPGIDGACGVDAAQIGWEYDLRMGSTLFGTEAFIGHANAGCGSVSAQSPPVAGVQYMPDGLAVTFPLSRIGGDDGKLNFKVLASTHIGPGAVFSSIQDVLRDVGSPAVKVQ